MCLFVIYMMEYVIFVFYKYVLIFIDKMKELV